MMDSDKGFASDPEVQLQFIYDASTGMDVERSSNLYPVARINR